ncbi:MAG TPA: sodium:solute symporter family protein [Bryobacteraceae bacterium]|nr:sodium:solute symporter family protein [Bryobacteraceae bacterium]
MTLRAIDYVSLIIYFIFVLGIGWLAKRKITTSEDFLTSRHSVPVWITSLAFIAANLGAQEMIGMCASGAKYGIMTAHFYWLGAVPAMVFVGVFMMPFYYGSRARSVPEYLKLRFDEKTRALNAVTFAIMTIFSSGISMYALGLLFELVLGWSFTNSVLLSAVIVLIYTLLGGLTSAIYNEVVQFFLIVLGFAPLSYYAVMKAGGWSGISQKLQPVMTHSWRYVAHASENPMGVELFGLVAGLGFVLSFGYWCTNFLVVQRAMAAKDMAGARQTPLFAAFPKILMPFVVILPGIAAVALMNMNTGYTLPLKPNGGGYNYDLVLTTLMAKFYPSGMLGIGLTALMASFMSGMAGNVTAFNTVFTYDLYQGYVRRDAPDSHYLWVGRVTTVAGVALSVGAAYLATHFNNIMDFLQLVFGFVNAPLFATFLLGMFWKRTTGHGAFSGLIAGTLAAAATHGLTVAEGKGGWIAPWHTFPSQMAQNFWIAIMAFVACLVVTFVVSVLTKPKPESALHNLVYGVTDLPHEPNVAWYKRPIPLAVIVLAVLVVFNIIFW